MERRVLNRQTLGEMACEMMIAIDVADAAGKSILIVEDEYFLARDMADAVCRAGGTVLGPVPDVAGAMAILQRNRVDAAILDIRLGEETSFPVASALKGKGVPVIFVTGYDDWYLPNDLDDVLTYPKTADPDNVVRLLFNQG